MSVFFRTTAEIANENRFKTAFLKVDSTDVVIHRNPQKALKQQKSCSRACNLNTDLAQHTYDNIILSEIMGPADRSSSSRAENTKGRR